MGGGFSALLQAVVFSKDDNTNNTDGSILRATIANVTIRTGTYPNGTEAYLGDNSDLGFPEALYPNITYNSTTTNTAFSDFPLNSTSTLLLGPVSINESYALVSITLPILDNNSNNGTLLGFMTVVAAATSIISVTQSREGLGNTGVVLLVGPSRRENLFRYEQRPATADYTAGSAMDLANVHFVLPPPSDNSTRSRHSQYLSNLTAFQSSNFTLKKYPAALNGFSQKHPGVNNQSSQMSTTNENNVSVAVGYARPQSSLVSWLLIVEQSHAEAWAPIYKLRKIVLACVFGTIGAIIVVIVPLAHFSVRPIRRLRDATKKSISPPGFSPREGSFDSDRDISGDEGEDIGAPNSTKSKKGFFVRLRNLTGTQKKTARQRTEEERRRTFKIPAKVKNRKHWITDELTELTGTFNDMTDELMLQYSSLEERVAQRTEELEIAKQAAETANEAKTLFIANISHELKTPLNGILGMCSICMSETDLDKIKRSLQIVYKSGDLLLHLLNDLLLFSKNQIGQQVSLEEREFRLIDIKTQVQTIFHKQVIDGKIDFSVKFIGSEPEFEHIEDSGSKLPALGPQGTGRLKDMSLWGDQHRILQIIINLVSNSLKFTPEGGKVEVRIQCTGEVETSAETSRNSMGSKQSSQRTTRGRHRHESGSSGSQISRKHSGNKTQGTALLINPMDKKATTRVVREREPTPPPPGARTLNFQFEVQDTGPGIPVSMRDRVFEPFVQGDLGLSKKFGGTGLGLSICSQLAKLMGGDIILDSAEGVGSTFTMNIPLKHTKSRASSTSSSAQGSRPTSEHTTSDARLSSPKRNVDTSMEKDSQPRLVGLSAPFFASAPLPSPEHDVKQLAALDTVEAARKAGSKLRVLVAEDNLVNQEVVLRLVFSWLSDQTYTDSCLVCLSSKMFTTLSLRRMAKRHMTKSRKACQRSSSSILSSWIFRSVANLITI